MKKSLLIALCSSVLLISSVNAKVLGYADVYLKSSATTSIKPLSTGTTASPVTAGVDGDLLTVNFVSPLGNTTVTIENSLGEIIYQETISVKEAFTLPISLTGEEADTYVVTIKSGKNSWYGEFDLL